MAKKKQPHIIGHHRSLRLAERHARDAGLVIIDRRNAGGHKSKRGHLFVFAENLIWRYTVAGIVPVRKKYHARTFMTWAKTKSGLNKEEVRKRLMDSLPGKKKYPWSKKWFRISEEVEQVEFETDLIGRITRTQ